MTTLAPASARACTQASPIARPPPVTRATRPSSLYLSKYKGVYPQLWPMLCRLIRRAKRLDQGGALPMWQGAPLGIEQVTGRRIDTNVDVVTHARRVAAFGLGDDEGLPGH